MARESLEEVSRLCKACGRMLEPGEFNLCEDCARDKAEMDEDAEMLAIAWGIGILDLD